MNYNEHVLMLLERINSRLGHMVEQKATRKKRSRKSNKELYTEEFNTFWKIYPRKDRKLDAAKAYHKAVKRLENDHEDEVEEDGPHDYLCWRAIEYCHAWPDERLADGDYRQHAATWLNQETYMHPEGFAGTEKQQSTRGPQWEPTLD